MEKVPLSVGDCIALVNQTLEYAYPTVLVEGEVGSFKVNQSKYVFFDLKDSVGTLNCFMSIYQLRTQLEDGMKVRVLASPKLTQWGRFSLTVREVMPVGEGSLKRAFDLLQAKLDTEGLFAPERKRPLPAMPSRIGVVTSTQAAGYADFVKILNARWGGAEVQVAHTLVQGMGASAQIVRAITYFNTLETPPDAIAVIRGGGSADDLAAFNDEPLVRAIAASRVPVIVGVGHETDTSLADMAADVSAVTPSNAAQLLVPDRYEVMARVDGGVRHMLALMQRRVTAVQARVGDADRMMRDRMQRRYEILALRIDELTAVLRVLNPRAVLERGYAIVRRDGRLLGSVGVPKIGDALELEMKQFIIHTEVMDVRQKIDSTTTA